MAAVFSFLAALALAGVQDSALGRGQRAFEAGDIEAAERAFREHLARNPKSAEALSNLAVIESRRDNFAKAIELYKSALAANPKLVQIRFNLGVAYFRSGNFVEAASTFRAFLKAYPKEQRARELLGLSLVETGDFRGAIEELEAAGGAQPSAAFSLAYAHARAGDPAKGSALLARLESHPVQARLIEGLIEERRERIREARAKYEEALRLDPAFAPASAALGRLLLQQHEDEAGIVHLQRAAAATPRDAELAYLLGVALDRTGRGSEAEAQHRRALSLRPGYAGPLYALAKNDLRDGRPAEAVAKLEQITARQDRLEAVYVLLGKAYQAMGRPAQAKEAFAIVKQLQQRRLAEQQKALADELVTEP